MLKMQDKDQLYLDDFKIQFGGKLRKDNRWVKQAEILPWDVIEEIYAMNFSENTGVKAIPSRIAFGAIYISECEGLTDRKTVEYITENPYMQYFIGLNEYTDEPCFDASMMVHFRKRFPSDFINRINEMIFEPEVLEEIIKKNKDKNDGDSPPSTGGGTVINQKKKNKGKLLIDATIAPADIRYPTDLSLLNEARENMEAIIEKLWEYGDREGHKTNYSRKKARKEYLSIAKQKKPRKSKTRTMIGRQLAYIMNTIEMITRLLFIAGIEVLTEKQHNRIMTVCELYRQQKEMYEARTQKCDDRIVNLRQPHIRPMVRGKTGKPYEFGQKIAASVVEGYTFIERQSYDGFNEGTGLAESVERYKERFGFYPETVLADKIYRNRDNLSYCKERGIKISGPPLGRPKVNPTKEEKNQSAKDNKERNAIEGRFGISKRKFGLGLIMSYLPETGKTEAALQVLCMNVSLKMGETIKSIFDKNEHRSCKNIQNFTNVSLAES
jgi:hypothetical protein